MLIKAGFSLRNHLILVIGCPFLRTTRLSYTCFKIKETKTSESYAAKNAFKINHHFHDNSNCIIYLLSCKMWGSQYVWSIADRFRLRWNNYIGFQRDVSQVVAWNYNMRIAWYSHCLEIVQIWRFLSSVFSCIRTEYRKIWTRNNAAFGHFSRSVHDFFFV